MSVNIGSSSIIGAKVGTTNVDRMYIGSTLLYGSAPTGTLYGRVYHYSDYTIDVENDVITVDTTSAITYTDLLSSTEYNNLTNADFYTVNGHALPRDAITSFEFGNSVTTTPYLFLYQAANLASVDFTYATSMTSIGGSCLCDCPSLNSNISLPSNLTTIGSYFLSNCSNFNSAITFPSGLTTIQEAMLQNCYAYNKDMTLPSSLTSLGSGFMLNCKAMIGTVFVGSINPANFPSSNTTFATEDSSAPCYTQGISIAGTTAASWLTKYPNRSSSPYRNLEEVQEGGGDTPDEGGDEAAPEE